MSQVGPARGVLTIVALTSAFAISAAAQNESVKQTEQLVKKSGDMVQAIAETKLQIGKTMEVYNGLFADDVKDRKDLYKKLQKEMDSTETKRGDITLKAGLMRTEADAVFKSWADSALAIENPDLRKRSEQRLEQTKASFAEIGAAGQKASEAYAPIMKTLQDHVTFLGHDLNASALASLKPDADKLNAQVQELNKKIDETITVANKNIGALRP